MASVSLSFSKWLEEDCSLYNARTVISKVHDDYLEPFRELIERLSSVSKWDLESAQLIRKTVQLNFAISRLTYRSPFSVEEEYSKKQVKLLTIACNDKFLEVLIHILQLWNKHLPESTVADHLLMISVFCTAVMANLPFLGKNRLSSLVGACMDILNDIKTHSSLATYDFTTVQKKIDELTEQVEVEEEARKMKEFTEEFERMLHGRVAPDDFRKVFIIPSLDELRHNKFPFLQPNKIKGAYEDAKHYLDVQFRLLREDFVQPLRKGVENLLQNQEEYMKPKGKFRNRNKDNIQVYTGITFHRLENEDGTHLFRLPFHLVNGVDWSYSKKLMPGCFVLLTADLGKTALFATIQEPLSKRGRVQGESPRVQELSRGLLRLKIEDGEELVYVNKQYIMLECEAYFEAYRYNLSVLQKITFLNPEERNPIGKFVVAGCSSVNLPGYFEAGHFLQLPVLCSPQQKKEFRGSEKYLLVPISNEKRDTWPTSQIKAHLQLDHDQYAAYRMALTSELAIIQGPPGTGKTFIGLQIVRTLLLNKGRGNSVPNSPILVLCETNHALDQFLELLLLVQDKVKIVRVGSQSESEELMRCTLYQRRKKLRRNPSNYRNKGGILYEERQIREKVSRMVNTIRVLKTEVSALENVSGLLNLAKMTLGKKLLGRIPLSLRKMLENEENCTNWLGIEEDTMGSESFHVSNVVRIWFNISDLQLKRSRTSVWPATQKMYFKEGSSTSCFKIASEWSAQLQRFKEAFENTAFGRILRPEDSMLVNCVLRLLEFKTRVEATKRKYENKGNLLRTICECFHQGKLELDDEEMLVENGEEFILKNGNDLSNYTIAQRWRIYFRVVQMAAEMGTKASAEKGKQLKDVRIQLKAARDKVDGWILSGTDIIGMTTTGAAKHHLLLEYAKPEIVIIEEAAEILEARVITSLTKDCKHLILIGDHLQLRPRPTVYELANKYHMNISFFERMILNGVKMCTLKTQHRMRPEISDLITGPVYETLHNHPCVQEYPPVKGVVKSLFFVTHTEPEKRDTKLMSKSNQHEADFIAGLCEYLLLQGYLPWEITVVAAYSAQVLLLQRMMPESCQKVYVTSIDSYQGEENKIILLSLVRSNQENKIGFVGIENRVCVALSRAKHGLFIIGNLNSFINVSNIWQEIHEKLESGTNCGDGLELKCEEHGKITKVQHGSDFLCLKPGGGCGELCNATLPSCFHLCPQYCHALDRSHKEFRCMEPCERMCKSGDHQCQAKCYAECPPCKVRVLRTLLCKHEISLPCYVPYDKLECQELVKKRFPCGHKARVACWALNEGKCDVKCEKKLKCGHQCTLDCHVTRDPNHLKYKCQSECQRRCPAGHKHGSNSRHPCYERCPPCLIQVRKPLECNPSRVSFDPCFLSGANYKRKSSVMTTAATKESRFQQT